MAEFKPFHLAFPIRDIEETRQFYGDLLGCDIGRSTDKWIDFNFFGHQLSAHIKPEELANTKTNEVDGKNVPVRHFGAILGWEEWHALADKLKAHGMDFVIEPYIRFKGEVAIGGWWKAMYRSGGCIMDSAEPTMCVFPYTMRLKIFFQIKPMQKVQHFSVRATLQA